MTMSSGRAYYLMGTCIQEEFRTLKSQPATPSHLFTLPTCFTLWSFHPFHLVTSSPFSPSSPFHLVTLSTIFTLFSMSAFHSFTLFSMPGKKISEYVYLLGTCTQDDLKISMYGQHIRHYVFAPVHLSPFHPTRTEAR